MKWQAIPISLDLLGHDDMLDHDGGDEYNSRKCEEPPKLARARMSGNIRVFS